MIMQCIIPYYSAIVSEQFVDPARPGQPKDKGKVERAVQPVRDLFRRLKAMDPGLTLAEANKKALYWCRFENGILYGYYSITEVFRRLLPKTIKNYSGYLISESHLRIIYKRWFQLAKHFCL
jgi:hypothetical protein